MRGVDVGSDQNLRHQTQTEAAQASREVNDVKKTRNN